jgi:hypothetical protein
MACCKETCMVSRIGPACISTNMHFNHWLLQRLPPSDKLVALIQQAGRNGIPEGELRSQIDLPMTLFNDLVQAMVGAGLVKVVQQGEKRVYLSR